MHAKPRVRYADQNVVNISIKCCHSSTKSVFIWYIISWSNIASFSTSHKCFPNPLSYETCKLVAESVFNLFTLALRPHMINPSNDIWYSIVLGLIDYISFHRITKYASPIFIQKVQNHFLTFNRVSKEDMVLGCSIFFSFGLRETA